MRPGPEVLASFGASADPVSLPGGQELPPGEAGEVVLKPESRPAGGALDAPTCTATWTPWIRWIRWTPGSLGRPPGPWLPGAAAAPPVAEDRAAGDWVAQDPLAERLGGLAVAARRARFVVRRLPVLASR